MEKSGLPIKDKGIIQNKRMPTPPTSEGVWTDKGRDHPSFQENVSLAAQLGGVHAGAGCPHKSAAEARKDAEQLYFQKQEIRPKQILATKKI